MNKFKFLIFLFSLSILLLGCETSNTDQSNTYFDNDYLQGFSNLSKDDFDLEGSLYEYQYKVDTVPDEVKSLMIDVNNNNELEQCFTYDTPKINITVDSVEQYLGEEISMYLIITADVGGISSEVSRFEISGLVFPVTDLNVFYDDDINDFEMIIEVFYEEEMINSISLDFHFEPKQIAIEWDRE